MKNGRKYLTVDEIQKILIAARMGTHSARNECFIYMCFRHGFRVSELCNLRLSDFDLTSKVIYINRLKNGFSTIHPILSDERELLLRWLNVRQGLQYKDSDKLFISQKSDNLSRQQVDRFLKKLAQEAGISVVPHPHMLRHSCGYELANLGTDTRLIQDYLGHRNINHTVIYTASNPQRFVGVWGKR